MMMKIIIILIMKIIIITMVVATYRNSFGSNDPLALN